MSTFFPETAVTKTVLNTTHTLTTTLVTTNLCEQQRYITTTTTNTKLLHVIRKNRAHSIASKWHTHTHTRKTDLLACFREIEGEKKFILKPNFKFLNDFGKKSFEKQVAQWFEQY